MVSGIGRGGQTLSGPPWVLRGSNLWDAPYIWVLSKPLYHRVKWYVMVSLGLAKAFTSKVVCSRLLWSESCWKDCCGRWKSLEGSLRKARYAYRSYGQAPSNCMMQSIGELALSLVCIVSFLTGHLCGPLVGGARHEELPPAPLPPGVVARRPHLRAYVIIILA